MTKPTAPSVEELSGKEKEKEVAPATTEQSTASKMDMKLLFVYGTLKRGHALHGWLEGQQFIGLAEVKDACLIDAGAYPIMVVPNPGSSVHGELYMVDAALFTALSNMESRAGYRTIIVSAKVLTGTAIPGTAGTSVGAYSYVFPTIQGPTQWENVTDKDTPKNYVGVISSVN